jgi:AraC-like DNA-binding protein
MLKYHLIDIHGYAVDLQKRLDNYHSLDQNLSVLYSNYPISPYTISNQFKKLTGYTVVEYRNIKRMEYAAHLLANENLSVASIANQMNISNLSYFAKQFKMQFGMSPKQYQLLKRKKK